VLARKHAPAPLAQVREQRELACGELYGAPFEIESAAGAFHLDALDRLRARRARAQIERGAPALERAQA